jgi:type I pantothenate kinase
MKELESPCLKFNREQWRQYRHNEPLTLSEAELGKLRGVNEIVSLDEIQDFYLPLSRLLNLYISQTQTLYEVTSQFLQSDEPKVPYIVGVCGSVAVGKSTTSRILKALLSRGPNHPTVSVINTDGFLYPTHQLQTMDLMQRKGFPESYDLKKLLQFLSDLKAGKPSLTIPVYSHHKYDIVPNEYIHIDRPDIVIIEGLNILQTGSLLPQKTPKLFVSDFLDFSIYVDAQTESIKHWYIDRVLFFCNGPFKEPNNYFHHLSKLNLEEQIKFAEKVWHEINEQNLLLNILPFRERAQLVLHKTSDHTIDNILLRKL